MSDRWSSVIGLLDYNNVYYETIALKVQSIYELDYCSWEKEKVCGTSSMTKFLALGKLVKRM